MSFLSNLNPKTFLKNRKNAAFKKQLLEAYHHRRSSRSLGFAGADQSRLIGAWNPGGQNQNQLIAAAAPLLRARVRDLTRNFPPFVRAINATVAFVVGKGARFQSLVTDSKGNPDKVLAQKIESRFRHWMDSCDIAKKLHFYEIQQLAVRQLMENGESICRFVKPSSRNRYPLAIQAHDAEALSSWAVDYHSGKNPVFQGIEYDADSGEVLKYHFLNDPSLSPWLKAWEEGSDNVLHTYKMLRPGQLRGISPFAAAVLTAKDMNDYTMAELDAAMMASKWLAFITTPNPAEFQLSRGLGSPVSASSIGKTRDDIEDLQNAMIEYLREGEAVNFAPSPGRPNDSFERFVRHALRMVSVVSDVPYEILSGDYTGINYSTSKASRNDFIQLLGPFKHMIESHLVRPVFYRWLDMEALTQNYLPGYFQDPWRYRKAIFIPAGMPSVDPLRDGKADIDAVNALLKSPQQVILARGDDPEEIINNWARWIDLCAAIGVDPIQAIAGIDTSLANNPAKIGAAESSEE